MTNIAENTPRTIALALGAWALTAAAGSAALASRFADGEIAGLAVFAFVYATATAFLDPQVRRHLEATRASGLAVWILGFGGFALLAWGPHIAGGQGAAPIGILETFTALFAAPVAASALVVLAARFARLAPVRSPAVKGPGARPAAS